MEISVLSSLFSPNRIRLSTADNNYIFARFFLAALLCCTAANAEDINLPRTAGAIAVDGVLDEDAWRGATQIELGFETQPGENIPARVKTVAYLMEDGTSLYVGFVASDPDPSKIRAYLRDRDTADNDDLVGIIIDTYNDGRRAFEFYANPLGVQMDLTNDDTANRKNTFEIDYSWDAIWDSAGRINGDGYVVEMRIPLNQLRFPAVDGKQTWGVDFSRTYPRGSKYRFSSNLRDRGINCILCQIGKLSGLENAEPGRDLEVVPTLTASQSDSTDEPGIDPMVSGSTKTEAGLSLRWGITPDLTANLAINPDFSQIEADASQLEVNNRFALFFPEKRPFFLEGADYFTTPFRAVFTRTIAEPEVGAKLTGKRGENTFGVFATQDRVTNLLFPGAFESDTTTLEQSNTSFVGRYSRGFGDTSSIGGLVTVRDGDGYHNYLASIDGRWKINDQHTLSLQHLESETQYPLDVAVEFEQPQGVFDGNATGLRYKYESRSWFGNLRHVSLSDGFRADSGFQARIGITKQTANMGHTWHGDDESWWYRMRFQTQYESTHLEDGTFAGKELSVRFGVGGPLQSWTQFALVGGSELDGGVLFNTQSIRFFFKIQPRGGLVLEVLTEIGEQIDYENTRLGDRKLLQPSINWNASRNLLVSMDGIFASLDTQDGEKIFDATVVDARVTWQFNVRSFLRVTVQHSETSRNQAVYVDEVDANSKDVGRQLLYSYKINPQTVFFLGYSDSYLDDDDLDGLTASDRSVFMKIGYAWNL